MLYNQTNELEGKKILITGCSGHLGLAVVKKILAYGIRPTLLLYQDHPEIKTIIEEFNLLSLKCDIATQEQVKSHAQVFGSMDMILHLAAYVPKKWPDDDPEIANKVNVVGTMNLAGTLKSRSKLIFASTGEVYGVPQKEIITENHLLQPLSYYGRSKAAAEIALKVHCLHHNINLTILRFTNIYGPGESIQRAIPNFIEAVLRKRDLQMYGDGSDLRDFLYIDDAANFVISAMNQNRNGTYNVASGKNYSIKEVAERIIALSKAEVKIVYLERKKARIDYVFDISKAARNLDYVPETSLDEGLQKEIEWFRNKKD